MGIAKVLWCLDKVYKWIWLFNIGREETHNEEHSDYPSGLGNDKMIEIVLTLLSNTIFCEMNSTRLKSACGGFRTFDGRTSHCKNIRHSQIFEQLPHGWKRVPRANNCNWRWNLRAVLDAWVRMNIQSVGKEGRRSTEKVQRSSIHMTSSGSTDGKFQTTSLYSWNW